MVNQSSESERNPVKAGLNRVVGLEHIDSDDLHIKRWDDIGDGTSFSKRFRKGQVLFGRRRAYLRKAACAEFDGICSGDITVLESKGDGLLPELLPFLVQTDGFYEHTQKVSAGGLSPRAKWRDLATYEFALPPIPEQRRIAEILWAADKAIGDWSAVADRTALLRIALLGHTFDDAAEKAASKCNGWSSVKLRECAEVQTGLAKGRRYGADETVALPYLRVANVQDGFVDLSEVKHIEVAKREIERYALRPGDVLLTEGGDFDKLGRGTIWRGQVNPCLHQNHIFAVRPVRDRLLAEFLTLQTASPYGRRYFLGCAKKSTNLTSVNATQVRNFPVLLPSLLEQTRIVDTVASLEKHATDTQATADLLRSATATLRESVLSLHAGGAHVH